MTFEEWMHTKPVQPKSADYSHTEKPTEKKNRSRARNKEDFQILFEEKCNDLRRQK